MRGCACGALFLLLAAAQALQAQAPLTLYGYFATRWEKVFDEPSLQGGRLVERSSAAEFSFPSFHLMAQQQLDDRFRVFVNLDGAGAGELSVRNFWGEYSPDQRFNVRIGKTYRKFGLYNEQLDAVPTYYGIEPPELFDADHLIVSRTTALMVHGSFDAGRGVLHYALSTDNGEGGAIKGSVPLGGDLRYQRGSDWVVGLSGYTSGGAARSDVEPGQGPPRSGVLPWMARDEFQVLGGYLEANPREGWSLQLALWRAAHEGVRDGEAVAQMLREAGLLPSQRARLLVDPQGPDEAANVRLRAEYDITTWYARLAYSHYAAFGEIAPYAQWDYYENPETVGAKAYGGDNEAGAADDGAFHKSTVGMVYRPSLQVAVKFDQSFHFYQLNGERVNYPELRVDLSFTFGL